MLNDIMVLPFFYPAVWLLICACLFGFLQSLFPLDPTPRPIRRDIWMDIGYWMLGPSVYASIGAFLIGAGFIVLFGGNLDAAVTWSNTGAPWLADWPLWLQALGVLIVTDISLYWTHRLFHSNALWRFHAIHHAPETLDWLHSVRFHPINLIFHSIFANAVALWIGFPPAAVAVLAPFNVLYSTMPGVPPLAPYRCGRRRLQELCCDLFILGPSVWHLLHAKGSKADEFGPDR
eukprot:gene7967-10805_t